MSVFFVSKDKINNNSIIIDDDNYNHIINVLRKNVGDTLNIRDGYGNEYICNISNIENNKLILDITETLRINSEPKLNISIYQGLPKSNKFDMIVQKSVELGATNIYPVQFKRSIVNFAFENPKDEIRKDKKTKRWQTISEGAAKQSGRGKIPTVSDIVSFDEAVEIASKEDIILFPYELADANFSHTREVIKSLKDFKNVGIFIGPEGGFDIEEVKKIREMNSKEITLGKRILRTETVALAILSMIMYELED